MLHSSIIRERYSSMTDEELVLFAKYESQGLSESFFQLLKDEFNRRSLDLQVMESAEIDRALAELQKHTLAEKQIAEEFTEALWQYAFEQKRKGGTDYELYNGLIGKGVDQQYAYMLIQSLEEKGLKMICSYQSDKQTGWLLTGLGMLFLYFAASVNADSMVFCLIPGVYAMAFGGLRIYKARHGIAKYRSVVQQIRLEREENE